MTISTILTCTGIGRLLQPLLNPAQGLELLLHYRGGGKDSPLPWSRVYSNLNGSIFRSRPPLGTPAAWRWRFGSSIKAPLSTHPTTTFYPLCVTPPVSSPLPKSPFSSHSQSVQLTPFAIPRWRREASAHLSPLGVAKDLLTGLAQF